MSPAHVTLWTAPPDLAASVPGWLSEIEWARAGAYWRPVDHDRFVVGASLARMAIARHTGADPKDVVIDRTCADCSRQHGRPTAPGTGVALSVSHAGGLVVVAASVDSVAVGVDIEVVPAVIQSQVLDLALSPDERAWVSRVGAASRASRERTSPEERFTRLWTLKEAAVKATGDGMRAELPEVGFAATARGAWRLATYPGRMPADPIALAEIPAQLLGPDLLGAVAALGADAVLLTRIDGATELARRSRGPTLPDTMPPTVQ